MDALVIESYVLLKEDQPALANDGSWQKEFAFD